MKWLRVILINTQITYLLLAVHRIIYGKWYDILFPLLVLGVCEVVWLIIKLIIYLVKRGKNNGVK